MRLALCLASMLLATGGLAQTVVEGRVTDVSTGETLPAATVQVDGTSRGTTTNGDGVYRLVVPTGGDTLVVRFLGYETARLAIPDGGGRLDVALAPAVAALGEAVVTAGVNPADDIMRRVIARKARWRSGLETWQAEVYSRQTIRADGQVVAVIEGQTDAFWDRQRGLREVVTATRRTGNLGALPLDAFTAADQALNLYDDDVPFGGYDLPGPTHPRALSYYRFSLDGSRILGTDRVYDLSFAPRNPLQPALEGSLSVLAGANAVLAVSARPSDAVQFPLVNQFALTLDQQFATFGQSASGEEVWLPVDFRMSGQGRIGNALLQFPDIGFAVNSRFTDFAVNVAVPDSLFDQDGAVVDSVSVAGSVPIVGVVPLSAEEERALAEIDSTETLASALRPTGLLARFVQIGGTDGSSSGGGGDSAGIRYSVDPALWYNRVEGAHLGGEATLRVDRHRLAGALGYQTEDAFAARAEGVAAMSRQLFLGLDVHYDVAPIGTSIYVTRGPNSLAALVAGQDYFDYVRRTGAMLWSMWRGRRALRTSVSTWAAYDAYDGVPTGTTWSLTGALPDENVRPDVDEVTRAGARARIGAWDGGLASGLAGQRAIQVRVESGMARVRPVSSQTAEPYGLIEGEVRWWEPVYLRRRLLPPTVHVRLAAGVASGDLPVTRAFGIDGRLAGVSPFGSLRARTGRLVLAKRYALIAWEHDLRSIPFELLGWRGAAPRGLTLQVHGAHAWADTFGGVGSGLGPLESVLGHHEVGVSLGLGYSAPVRLDMTYRLGDDSGVVIGVGVARLF